LGGGEAVLRSHAYHKIYNGPIGTTHCDALRPPKDAILSTALPEDPSWAAH